jgi:hypothetical protein
MWFALGDFFHLEISLEIRNQHLPIVYFPEPRNTDANKPYLLFS